MEEDLELVDITLHGNQFIIDRIKIKDIMMCQRDLNYID